MIRFASIPLAALSLGACTLTATNGDQTVLTPQNAAPLVAQEITKVCAAYDANKVTVDALATVAITAINNTTVTNASATVTQIATAACPLLEALLATTTVPATTTVSGTGTLPATQTK